MSRRTRWGRQLQENGPWPVSSLLLSSAGLIADLGASTVNDCGKWLNSVGNGQRYDGTYYFPNTNTKPYQGVGSCDRWNVSSADLKAPLLLS